MLMNPRLAAVARARQGVFSSADAYGWVSAHLGWWLVRAGDVIQVRRGAFVLTSVDDCADEPQRYRLRVLAVSGPGALRGEMAPAPGIGKPRCAIAWRSRDAMPAGHVAGQGDRAGLPSG